MRFANPLIDNLLSFSQRDNAVGGIFSSANEFLPCFNVWSF